VFRSVDASRSKASGDPGRHEEQPAGGRLASLALFHHTTDAAVAVDADGRVLLWNRAAEHLLGHAASEVLGRHCHEVLQGRGDDGHVLCHPGCRVLTMAKRHRPAPACDLRVRRKTGAERWLNVSTVLVPHLEGVVVVHLVRDVTATRTRQRAVEALLRRTGEAAAPPVRVSGELPAALTVREREVLALLASGESTQAIARLLVISPVTVRNHTQNILVKLGVHSRLAAATLALRSRAV